MSNATLTQSYSTWGSKLLQHTDRLHEIQAHRKFRPITVQIAPTEVCDSRCTFCSVGERPGGKIPFEEITAGLADFAYLGARSLEITGGGNPLLYRDHGKTIDDVVKAALDCRMKVGVITNSERPGQLLSPAAAISWLRVSLAKLDEGLVATDFDLSGFEGRLGLSYIIHDRTTPETIAEIARVVDIWPGVKFVRLAADCTTDDSRTVEERWGGLVESLDCHSRFFIKAVGDNYHPYPGGCWVGAIRPYWTSTGIYICTSHVLKTRRYEPEWRLCGAAEILPKWREMNERFAAGHRPYDIDLSKCWHCYYFNNNALLHAVAEELPDKDFA